MNWLMLIFLFHKIQKLVLGANITKVTNDNSKARHLFKTISLKANKYKTLLQRIIQCDATSCGSSVIAILAGKVLLHPFGTLWVCHH